MADVSSIARPSAPLSLATALVRLSQQTDLCYPGAILVPVSCVYLVRRLSFEYSAGEAAVRSEYPDRDAHSSVVSIDWPRYGAVYAYWPLGAMAFRTIGERGPPHSGRVTRRQPAALRNRLAAQRRPSAFITRVDRCARPSVRLSGACRLFNRWTAPGGKGAGPRRLVRSSPGRQSKQRTVKSASRRKLDRARNRPS